MDRPLLIIDQRVLSADVNFGSHEAHDLAWKISYAPKEDGEAIRFLQCWLHGCDDDVVFSVTTGALLEETQIPYSESDLESILRDEYYVSSLYATARKSARVVLALMEEDFSLPEVCPIPSIGPLGAGYGEDEDNALDESARGQIE